MILDSQLKLCSAQDFSTDAASTNYIDLGGSGNNIFDGEPMAVLLHITTAADGTTTDETYEFQLQCDDNTSFSSATNLLVHSIGYASLTANSLHVLPVPAGKTVERYFRLYFNGGGTTPTVSLSAYLVPLSSVQKYRVYADALTIS